MGTLPLLEHTSNETKRLMVYHIQHGDTDKNKFFLYKTAVLPGGVMQPEGVVFACENFDWLHSQVVEQGFVTLLPTEGDDPRIMMTYL